MGKVRTLVYEPTRSLARLDERGLVQVIRDGREVVRRGMSSAYDGLSLARDGTLFLEHLGLLDLSATPPTHREWKGLAVSGTCMMHPDGRIAVVMTHAPAADPNAYAPVREMHRSVPNGKFRIVLASREGGPLEVLVEASASVGGGRPFDYLAAVSFAPDGAHWVVLAPGHLILGRTDRVLAHHAASGQIPRGSFDLARGTFLMTNATTLSAYSLDDGRLVAQRTFPTSKEHVSGWDVVRTALVPRGDQLLALLIDGRASYAMHAFDPITLEPRGRVPDMPVIDDPEGDFALVPLGERGLAVAPSTREILLIDADDSWSEGPLCRRARRGAGSSAPRIAGPDQIASASPTDRTGLAGHLLEVRARDPRFEPLVRAHPESFHPHLADVIRWPREWRAMLPELHWRRWAQIARGVGDDVVDALADAIVGEKNASDVETLLALLIAADTPRGLARLGDLARAHRSIASECKDRGCLEIPSAGAAIRRFDADERVLFAVPSAGPARANARVLETRLEAALWLDPPRGLTCLLAPTHLLAVPLALLACDARPAQGPSVDPFHFTLSDCGAEGCEEWSAAYTSRAGARPGTITLVSDLHGNLGSFIPCGPGETRSIAKPHEARRVELVPFDPADGTRPIGRIGGRPEWTQDSDIPECPSCGRMMFFIGQVESYLLEVGSSDLFGFVCERCGTAAQQRQNT